jgi:hypothetical protein
VTSGQFDVPLSGGPGLALPNQGSSLVEHRDGRQWIRHDQQRDGPAHHRDVHWDGEWRGGRRHRTDGDERLVQLRSIVAAPA